MEIKTDPIKSYREFYRRTTIAFVSGWADEMLRGFKEPSRAGTKKGDPIGFTRSKMQAPFLMTLFPVGLSLKEIAGMCGTSKNVLQVWRTQEKFQEEIDRVNHMLSEKISRALESVFKAVNAGTDMGKWQPPFMMFEGVTDPSTYLISWAGILPFLNPSIGGPLLKPIAKEIMNNPMESSAQAIFLHKVQEFARVKNKKDQRRLEQDRLSATKIGISVGLDRLANSKPNERAELKENLEYFIFSILDILAYGKGRQSAKKRRVRSGTGETVSGSD